MSASSFVTGREWDSMPQGGKRFTPLKDSTSDMWKANSSKRLVDGFNEASETLSRQFVEYLKTMEMDLDNTFRQVMNGHVKAYPFRITNDFVFFVAGYGETFLMPVSELR